MAIPIPNKSFTTDSGTKYAYIHYVPSNPNRPTLLFLHGFPSTSHEWRHQIPYFKSRGYGLLVPDLLGYGGSSKPLDANAYIGKRMSADIIAMLDHERILGNIIAVAHDWGTYLLSQLAVRYPTRFEKFVFMSVPFTPPGRFTDAKALNEITRKTLGYEVLGYWFFLTEPGAGKTIGQHWNSFFHLAFPADPTLWATSFAPLDGLKKFITRDSRCDLAPYVTPEDKAHHHSVFGNDYSAPVNWYKRAIANLGLTEEKKQLKCGEILGTIKKETLMITGLKDAVCGAEHARTSMLLNVAKGRLVVRDVDASHWIMLEKPEETNYTLEEFIEKGAGMESTKAML